MFPRELRLRAEVPPPPTSARALGKSFAECIVLRGGQSFNTLGAFSRRAVAFFNGAA